MIRRAILFLAAAAAFAQADGYLSVSSPDDAIEFRLFNAPPDHDDSTLPRLAYSVTYHGRLLIETSSLGYDIEDAVPLGEKLSVIATERETIDETYTLPHGKARRVRNHYNSLMAELLQEGSQGRMVTMEIRVFDDGLAFRYHIPPSPPLVEMRALNERTQFQLARDATLYAQTPAGFHLGYEDEYHRHTLSGIHSDAPIALPLLAEVPGVAWVGITEANVDDYANLYLQHTQGRILSAYLAPMLDGSGLAARRRTPFASPWRVLLIGDTPSAPAASNILTSLNEPNAIGDTSWIAPSAVGPQGWLSSPWVDVEANYEKAFPQYQARGVRGVVITGILREDQATQAALRRVFAKAAEFRLMLKLHDAAKPDGSERTFPNVIAREAAITNEHAQWGARANPDHNVLLAFTRLMAGPIDYTPGGTPTAREEFVPGQGAVLGTAAHQAALEVIFGASAWDETRAVGGDPSSYFAIARRKGNDWWLAVINNGTARRIDLTPAFLGSGEYTTEVVSDYTITQSAGDAIGADLAPGGGLLIHFKK